MIRERKSSGELVMSLEAFKRFPFNKACAILGLKVKR